MTAVLRAREQLLAELGHEPTLSAVARLAGVVHSTAHNHYRRAGLDTKAGHGARARARVLAARAALLVSLEREPTLLEVSASASLSDAHVSTIYKRAGLDTRAGMRAKSAAEAAPRVQTRAALARDEELARTERRERRLLAELAAKYGADILCKACRGKVV